MENTKNIVWNIPIAIVNQVAEKVSIIENQKHVDRVRDDIVDVLMCYRRYAKLMSKGSNALYFTNLGEAYQNANEQYPLHVTTAAIKYDIVMFGKECIRVYLEIFDRNVNTLNYTTIQRICEIYPSADIPQQANEYTTLMLKYLHTICPIQFASWDFVTDKSDWKYPEDNTEV